MLTEAAVVLPIIEICRHCSSEVPQASPWPSTKRGTGVLSVTECFDSRLIEVVYSRRVRLIGEVGCGAVLMAQKAFMFRRRSS